MLGSLSASCNVASLQRTPAQPHKARQCVSVRCSMPEKDAGTNWIAKPASLASGLLAAAVVSLTPQPAVALEAARIAPNQIAQVAQAKSLLPEDATFQPEKSVPGDSTAQEAAARANPAPFDPVVVGSSAGLLLLAFGISTGRADPQLKMASKKSPGGAKGGKGAKEKVKDRKKQARSWIGDWQKRTKKSS